MIPAPDLRMNENMEFPGATEADINWLQDCFVQFLKDKVACLFDDNDNDNDNDHQYHYNINWLVVSN